MPVLPKPMQEVYANQRASGVASVAAAIAAGYKQPHVECARLNKKPEVIARIEELRPVYEGMQRQALVQATVPTRTEVLIDLVECRNDAKARNDLPARMRANELIGKELGMFVTRVDARVDSPLDSLGAKGALALLALLQREDVEFVPAQPVEVIEHADDPLA
jgi:hypothetical protein